MTNLHDMPHYKLYDINQRAKTASSDTEKEYFYKLKIRYLIECIKDEYYKVNIKDNGHLKNIDIYINNIIVVRCHIPANRYKTIAKFIINN